MALAVWACQVSAELSAFARGTGNSSWGGGESPKSLAGASPGAPTKPPLDSYLECLLQFA